MFFVCLHVLTKLHLTVRIEVQLVVEYDFRWALRFGDATLQGKHVAPEHGCVYHFYYYDRRQVVKQNYVAIAVNPVLDGTVILLNLWDVLVSRCDVKLGIQVRKVATHWLELVVYKHGGDFETSGDVRANQRLEMLE